MRGPYAIIVKKEIAQGKFGLKHFSSIVVSGFDRNARGQIQIAHSHDTVSKADKALTVSFPGRRRFS
jgi:hypothetical protein